LRFAECKYNKFEEEITNEYNKIKGTRMERVKIEIVTILNAFLPECYDREIFTQKSSIVFNHIVDQAITGYNWVA